jgi:hypothetical protein
MALLYGRAGRLTAKKTAASGPGSGAALRIAGRPEEAKNAFLHAIKLAPLGVEGDLFSPAQYRYRKRGAK